MNQSGIVNPLSIPFGLAVIVALVFGGTTMYYYAQFTDYRDNTNAKIDLAVEEANNNLRAELEADFAERLKDPNDVYEAPAALSSVKVTYPKTWSAYVIEKTTGNLVIDGYFHPGAVPDVRSDTNFALRLELANASYANELKGYQRDVDSGALRAKAVTINGVEGVLLSGSIEREVNGELVLLPVRDKTLKVWTEAKTYSKDFNDIILPQLTFIP